MCVNYSHRACGSSYKITLVDLIFPLSCSSGYYSPVPNLLWWPSWSWSPWCLAVLGCVCVCLAECACFVVCLVLCTRWAVSTYMRTPFRRLSRTLTSSRMPSPTRPHSKSASLTGEPSAAPVKPQKERRVGWTGMRPLRDFCFSINQFYDCIISLDLQSVDSEAETGMWYHCSLYFSSLIFCL